MPRIDPNWEKLREAERARQAADRAQSEADRVRQAADRKRELAQPEREDPTEPDPAADMESAARCAGLPEGYGWAVVRNPWRRLLRFLANWTAVMSGLALLVGTPIGFSSGLGIMDYGDEWVAGLLMLGAALNGLVVLVMLVVITRCIPYYRREPAPQRSSGKLDYGLIGRGRPGRGSETPERRSAATDLGGALWRRPSGGVRNLFN